MCKVCVAFPPGGWEILNTNVFCCLAGNAFALVSAYGGAGSGLWLRVGLIRVHVGGSVSHGLTLDLVKETIAESPSMTRDLLN